MSQKNEKIRRKVDRLEGQMEFISNSFEAHLARAEYEQACREQARNKARDDRQYRRELESEYAAKHWQTVAYAAIIAAIAVLIVAISAVRAEASELQAPVDESELLTTQTITYSENNAKNTPIFVTSLNQITDCDEFAEDFENEKIEAALRVKANVIENCEVTWYTEATCGKTPDHPAYGITRSGLPVVDHLTCAVDPKVIPLYSDVWVEYADGTIEQLWATDTGVNGNALDIYTPDYDYAMQCGRQRLTVYWIPPGEVD